MNIFQNSTRDASSWLFNTMLVSAVEPLFYGDLIFKSYLLENFFFLINLKENQTL